MSIEDLTHSLNIKIESLPVFSPVVRKISSVLSAEGTSASDVVEALKLDPAISSKVLRLANSAYIGIPRSVGSLQNAVVILGTRRIYSLVLASQIGCSVSNECDPPFNRKDFWKHSITSGIIAESISKHLGRYEPLDSGEMFCAGILHDIGKLILSTIDRERVETVIDIALREKQPFFKTEEESASHMLIGHYVARHWNFPDNLTESIRYHHSPSSSESYKKAVSIVHLSDIMAHLIGFQTFPGELIPEIDESAVEQIELSPERLRVIASEAVDNEEKMESVINFIL